MLGLLLDSLIFARRLRKLGRVDLLSKFRSAETRAAAKLAYDLLPVRPRTVFDGGYHLGSFSRLLASIYPGLSVAAADPFDLRGRWQFTPCHFFNVALDQIAGIGEIHLVNDPQLHSLLTLNPKYADAFGPTYEQTPERKSITVRPIDDLLAEVGWDGCDLLKLDLQGSELAALRGAEKSLRRIGANIWKSALRKFMKASHYSKKSMRF